MRGGKRVARPDDRLMGTPPTAQEGAVRIIRMPWVYDPDVGLHKNSLDGKRSFTYADRSIYHSL